MKKAFLLFIVTLTCALHAEIGKDQFAQISQSIQLPYGKALEICKEKGFSHFVFNRITCLDDKGQTLEFNGGQNTERGESIVETMEMELNPAFGKQKIEFEILCFKETPKNPLAVDVEAIYKFMETLSQQQPPQSVAGSKVREIASLKDLEAEISRSVGPVYLDCYSATCPPCRTLAPKYDQYSIDLASEGTFLKINLDTNPEMRAQYKIEGVPTLIVFKNRKVAERKIALPEILKYFEALKN